MRRTIAVGWAAASGSALLLVGCAEETPSSCSTDADCEGLGRCEAGLCVEDPTPAALLAADRTAARLGQVVTLDATGSGARGAEVTLDFQVAPAGVGTLEVDGAQARFTFTRPHEEATIRLVVTTATGREAEASRAIAPENSPPVVTLEADPPGEPGAVVPLRATVVDVDGDLPTFVWSGGAPGLLDAPGGAEASLRTSDAGDALLHAVTVEAQDAFGGSARATLELTPRNVAPRLVLGAPPVADHACDATTCEARLLLPVAIEDLQGVVPSFSLLEAGPGVEVAFVERAAALEVVATAPQGTRLAGPLRVRVAAIDALGLEGAAEATLEVGNRAPTLVVHDGSALPHVYTGSPGQPYRAERGAGVGVTFADPDGDLPLVAAWSASSPVVRFLDATSPASALVVEGEAGELEGLTIAATFSEANGGEATHEAPLPIANGAPTLEITSDGAEGHAQSGDPALPYERVTSAAAFAADDPDGDPLTIDWTLAPEALAAGVVAVEGAPTPTFRVPAALLPLDVAWSATARDAFGAAAAAAEGVTRISNRPPNFVLAPASPQVMRARSCAIESCCLLQLCGDMSVARQFPGDATDGPLRLELPATVRDPDGDPLVSHLELAAASAALNAVAGASGGALGPLPRDVACADGSCDVSAELRGRVSFGLGGCTVAGVPLEASATLRFTLDDGLGGTDVTEVLVQVPDDPADATCP